MSGAAFPCFTTTKQTRKKVECLDECHAMADLSLQRYTDGTAGVFASLVFLNLIRILMRLPGLQANLSFYANLRKIYSPSVYCGVLW